MFILLNGKDHEIVVNTDYIVYMEPARLLSGTMLCVARQAVDFILVKESISDIYARMRKE